MRDDERSKLKAISFLAFERAGGHDACALISTRIKGHNAYSEYGSEKHANRQTPVDVAVEIDRYNLKRDRNAPLIVRTLARMLGFLLVATPSRRIVSSTFEALTTAIKEASEAIAAITPLLAAGHETALGSSRRDHTIQQIDEALEALLEVRARLEPPADGGDE